MSRFFPKITEFFPKIVEALGITLVVIGVNMIFTPLAFIIAGGFIVWISEIKS